jgi:uncharacterized ubiquitin-like protein YukD
MTENVTQQESIQEQTGTSQQGADLNISDLAAIKSIIDVATQRGAFRAPELEAVGKIYNKLSTFLESVSKKEQ